MPKVVFTDNSDVFLSALNAARDRALEICGEKAESYAKAICPVDTGRLRNSISHMQYGEDEYIGSNVEYAPYIELGTRKMKARPFLRPAAEEHSAEYSDIMKKELMNG